MEAPQHADRLVPGREMVVKAGTVEAAADLPMPDTAGIAPVVVILPERKENQVSQDNTKSR